LDTVLVVPVRSGANLSVYDHSTGRVVGVFCDLEALRALAECLKNIADAA